MPTYSANPDLLDAVADHIEIAAVNARIYCVTALQICSSAGYWSMGQTVANYGWSVDGWSNDWAESLRSRASLLRAYEEIALVGAGGAGGAGAALSAGRQWALQNGDERLSFEEWYSGAMTSMHAKQATAEVTDMLVNGATTAEVQTYLQQQTGLPQDVVDQLLAAAIAEELVGIDGPRGHAVAAQLRDQLALVYPDRHRVDEAFSLIVAGTPAMIAFAVVSGDWSLIEGGNPGDYTTDEKRVVLSVLGVDLPNDLQPGDLIGIDEIVGALPDDVVAHLFSVGRRHDAVTMVGLTTPLALLSPARASATRQIGGTVQLSEVQVGIGFEQSHSVEISAQFLGAGSFYIGKSPLEKAYNVLKHVPKLGAWAEALMARSGLLSRISSKLPFSFQYTKFAGMELQYEATINPEQAALLAGGDGSVLPDIFAPLDLQPGNSLLIRGGAIEGSTFAIKYKKLYLEETLTEFDGLGFGVTRLDDGRFAMYSGPVEAIERQIFLGFKFGVQLGFTSRNEYSDYEFTYAEVDLDTPEGVAAYEEFISGGGVPTSSYGPGVLPATVDVFELDSESGIAFGIGGLSTEWELAASNLTLTTTTYPDGTQVYEGVGNYGQAAVQFISPVGPDGTYDYDEATLTVMIQDVHGSMISTILAGMGEIDIDDRGQVETQHMQLTFTGPELLELQDLAQESLQAIWQDDYEHVITNPGISITEQLAAAETQEDIINVIARAADFRPDWLVHELAVLGLDGILDFDDTLPGDLELSVGG